MLFVKTCTTKSVAYLCVAVTDEQMDKIQHAYPAKDIRADDTVASQQERRFYTQSTFDRFEEYILYFITTDGYRVLPLNSIV